MFVMKLSVVLGDITELEVDAVVNAANTSLLGGGGVDGAIHQKAGPELLEQCKMIRARQGGCAVGDAVITAAGNLPARYVIHTVGPTWVNGTRGEDDLLVSAYRSSLKCAEENGVESIAFPNISTGVYRFPKERAARLALETVRSYQSNTIKEVIFVCFGTDNHQLYLNMLK